MLKQMIAVVVFYAKRIIFLIEGRETDIEQKQRQDHPVVDVGVVLFLCWFFFRNSYSTLRVPNQRHLRLVETQLTDTTASITARTLAASWCMVMEESAASWIDSGRQRIGWQQLFQNQR